MALTQKQKELARQVAERKKKQQAAQSQTYNRIPGTYTPAGSGSSSISTGKAANSTSNLNSSQKQLAREVAARRSQKAKQAQTRLSTAYDDALARLTNGDYMDRAERVDAQKQMYQMQADAERVDTYNRLVRGYTGANRASDTIDALSALAGQRMDMFREYSTEQEYEDSLREIAEQAAEIQRLSEYDTDAALADIGRLEEQKRSQQAQAVRAANTSKTQQGRSRIPATGEYEQIVQQARDGRQELDKQIQTLQRDINSANFIQKQNEYASYTQNPDFAEYAARGEAMQEKNKVAYANSNDFAIRDAQGFVSGGTDTELVELGKLRHLTDEEKQTYNYILAKEGETAADAYIEHMTEILNSRVGADVAQNINDVDSGLVKAFAIGAQGLGAGLEQFGRGVQQLFSEDALPTSHTQYATQGIRENLAEVGPQLPEWLGGDTLSQAAYDTAITTANMVPSILLSYVTAGLGAPAAVAQAVGGVALGASAGGNAYNQALKDGYTQKQARNYATLVGASESVLQYVLGGVGKLGGIATNGAAQAAIRNIDNALLRVAAQTGIQMAGEGVEEYLQSILEPVYRNLCFDENNEFRLFTEEAAYSALLGAVTAAFFEGPSTIGGGISSSRLGSQVQTSGKVDALIQAALALDPASEAFKLAEGINSGRVNANNSNVGDLLKAYTEAGGNGSEFLTQPEVAEEANENVDNISENLNNVTAPEAEQQDIIRELAEEVAAREQAQAQATGTPTSSRSRAKYAARRSAQAPIADSAAQADRSAAQAAQTPDRAVATTSKAVVKDTGAEIEIDGVASVKNGNVYVATSDGSERAASDISFASPETEKLYTQAAQFETNGAKAFVAGYDGSIPVNDYTLGFTAMYGAARTGSTYENAIAQSEYSNRLSTEARRMAYFAGQNAAKAPVSAAPQTPTGQQAVLYATNKGKSGGVVRRYNGTLSTAQENQVSALDVVFKALGRTVEVVDSLTTQDKAGRTVQSSSNASFNPATNTYTIALDGISQAYIYFAVHESVHDIRVNNRKAYEKLEAITIAYIMTKDVDVNAMMEYQKKLAAWDMSTEEAMEEVVANTVPAILRDPQTAREFAERFMAEDATTRSVFKKLLDSILGFLNRAYDVLSGQKSWKQLKAIEQDIQALTDIREAYFDALEGIRGTEAAEGRNTQRRDSSKETTDWQKKDIRFSAKDLENMTPAQIARLGMDLSADDANTTPKLKRRGQPSGINAETGKESSLYESTLGSSIVYEEVRELIRDYNDIRYYAPISNPATLEAANEKLNAGGKDEAIRWERRPANAADAVEVAEGFILLKRYQDVGDFDSALLVVEKLRKIGTTAGQAIQAFSLLGRMTPAGMQVYAQRELDKALEEMISLRGKKWVEKHKDMFRLTAEEMQLIQDTIVQASSLPEGRDKNILLAQIASMLEAKLPTNALRMIKGWARNSMLLNPKTMLRNVLGNAIMMPAYAVNDFVGAGLDRLIAKKTGVRTTGATLPTKAGIKAVGRGVFESYDDFRRHINTRQIDGDRFEIGAGDTFHRYKKEQLKATKNPAKKAAMRLSNALNTVDRVTGFLLDVGDRPFFEYHFTNALNNQLRLNKTTEPTESMIKIAQQEALQRTWQDDNGLTKAVATIKNALNFGKEFGIGSLVIPFTKTPANLTKALLEYSPAGLIKAIAWDAHKFLKSYKNGQADAYAQKRFVNSVSKGITGTLISVLGYILANAGILTGAEDEDKDLAAFNRNIMGISPYSVRIGDTSFSYDWMQPIGGTFAITADFVQNVRAGKSAGKIGLESLGTFGNAIFNALSAGGNVLFEQSFLKGLAQLFTEDGLVAGLVSSITGSATQFVPTAVGQIAQMADPYVRTSYVYNDIIRTTGKKLAAKIPGARNKLPIYVDVLGRDVNAIRNPAHVALNPTNIYPDRATKAALEIYGIYEQTGELGIIPKVAPYYLNHDGEKYVFTPEERADYQRTAGQTNEQVVNELISSKTYNSLSGEDKAETLKEAVAYASKIADEEYFGKKGIEYKAEPWVVEAQAPEELELSTGDYLVAKTSVAGIQSLKDKNGVTIPNSKALQVMEAINALPGFTEEQRMYLYECFDVGSSVMHYNPELVKNQLEKFRSEHYVEVSYYTDQMNAAIAEGDASAANKAIKTQLANGKSEKSIKSSITAKYKDEVIAAYKNGDRQKLNELRRTLAAINLYDSDDNRYYSTDRISDWIEDYKDDPSKFND